MLHQNKTFWIFTVSIFIILLIPAMMQQGMFLDGITYGAIAKNMAEGIGSFWSPHYTNTLHSDFFEHPPFVFGLQSLFFKIFGNSFFTENIYSLFTCLLSSVAILLIWNQMFKNTEYKNWGWVPLLLWIITPIINWSFKNNLLENTLSVFTLFAVFFQILSIRKNNYILLILASLSIVLGFLSKGFVALFPLITFWIYILVFKEFKKLKLFFSAISSTILPILFLIILYFLSPGFQNNFDHYLSQQLFPAIQNQREITTHFHVSLVLQLLIQLIIPIMILTIFIVFRYLKKEKVKFGNHKIALFFVLIALSASLPLMITLKQRTFYLVPSIPFFILALSCFVIPIVKSTLLLISIKIHHWIQWISILLIVITLSFSIIQFGEIKRDRKIFHEMKEISRFVPENENIFTHKSIWENWTLSAYLSRYHNISLNPDVEEKYMLFPKQMSLPPHLIDKFELVNSNLIDYKLFKKKQ